MNIFQKINSYYKKQSVVQFKINGMAWVPGKTPGFQLVAADVRADKQHVHISFEYHDSMGETHIKHLHVGTWATVNIVKRNSDTDKYNKESDASYVRSIDHGIVHFQSAHFANPYSIDRGSNPCPLTQFSDTNDNPPMAAIWVNTKDFRRGLRRLAMYRVYEKGVVK